MMWQTLLDLALVMARLGLSAVAGSGTIVGELGREAMTHGWMTAEQFTAAYALSQLAPGPGTLVVIPIGYQAAGVLGATVALLAFSGPTAVITAATMSVWGRVRGARWAQTGRMALMPVAAGLVLAAVFTLARSNLSGIPGVMIGIAAFAIIWRTRVSAALVVLGGMALGLAAARFG